MYIVGIHSGASSSLTILKNGKNIFSASEERFSRKKEHIGFPYLALEHAFKEKIISPSDVKIVARTSSMHKTDDMKCYKGHDWIKEIFYEHGCSNIEVVLYDHHLGHAASAYHGSGWDDALVVTSDGYGDGLSGAVYHGKNGQLKQINAIKDQDSIGLLYAGVTSHLGFIADRHEGKITGLAAYGKNTGFYEHLKNIMRLDKGTLYNTYNRCASIEKYTRKKHYTSRKMIVSHCLETLGLYKTIKFFWYYLDVFKKRKGSRLF